MSRLFFVQTEQSIETNARVYIIMEEATGGDLLNTVRKHKRIAERQAAVWFRQICDGVEYCHQRGIVHRDLKCENILLDTRVHTEQQPFISFSFSLRIKTCFFHRPFNYTLLVLYPHPDCICVYSVIFIILLFLHVFIFLPRIDHICIARYMLWCGVCSSCSLSVRLSHCVLCRNNRARHQSSN